MKGLAFQNLSLNFDSGYFENTIMSKDSMNVLAHKTNCMKLDLERNYWHIVEE